MQNWAQTIEADLRAVAQRLDSAAEQRARREGQPAAAAAAAPLLPADMGATSHDGDGLPPSEAKTPRERPPDL